MRMRGRWFAFAGTRKSGRSLCCTQPISCVSRRRKKLAWQDLRMLEKEIDRLQLFAKGGSERDGT